MSPTMNHRAHIIPGLLGLVSLLLLLGLAGCHVRSSSHPTPVKVWTERELQALVGKTREEVRAVLGTPNGFYTRSAEGRWHYSSIFVDAEGTGPARKVWVVIYFSKFGEQPATLVEIHDHVDQQEP
jgi:hypothetical protein